MEISATTLLNRLLARGKFRHVQVILKLAELGSVQSTADAIGMTQSSVTQTLAYLERLMDLRLFDRHARGVRPTAACINLLPIVRQLLNGLSQGADVAVASRVRGRHLVRMVASASATHGMLLPALPAFHDDHPQIHLQLSEAEGDDLLLAVTRGEVDLVACRRPPVVPKGWLFHELVDDRLVVVCAPDHALARRRRLRWEDLADQTWLPAPAGSAARACFDDLALRFPDGARTYPVVSRIVAVSAWLMRHRRVIGFLPHSFVRHLLDVGELILLPVRDAMPLEPLGLMVPTSDQGLATTRILDFMRSFHAGGALQP